MATTTELLLALMPDIMAEDDTLEYESDGDGPTDEYSPIDIAINKVLNAWDAASSKHASVEHMHDLRYAVEALREVFRLKHV